MTVVVNNYYAYEQIRVYSDYMLPFAHDVPI